MAEITFFNIFGMFFLLISHNVIKIKCVMKRLVRSRDSKIAGVCAGVANFFGWNVGTVRILWFFLTIAGVGSPVIFYLILALVMPMESAGASYAERMEKRLRR